MAIESISGKTVNTVLPTKTGVKDAVGIKEQPAAAVSEDTVVLTATAQDLKNSPGATADTALVNEERVSAIKTELQTGSYKIDAERVAEKILQFEAKFPGST